VIGGVHSRSRLAGYDPELLHQARVVVVGLGALGQNAAQNLALSGVGNLLFVDFDAFEPHNATRSPFYPTAIEIDRFGLQKSATVSRRVLAASTAPNPQVYFLDDLVQCVGDGAVRWANVVVSAVDSVNARAWLAERCRIHGKPLVEGGFAGAKFNFSAFSPAAGEPCYRCVNPSRSSSFSCTQYALAAERMDIIPAIQTTAATLGGFQAEHVIQILHRDYDRYGIRYYGNIREPGITTAILAPAPDCPGRHLPLPVLYEISAASSPRTVGDLLKITGDQLGEGFIQFAEPLIVHHTCTRCLAMCRVSATEAAWLRSPHCTACGGPWPTEDAPSPSSLTILSLDDAQETVHRIELASVGLRPGGAVIVQLVSGQLGTVTFPGCVLDAATNAGRVLFV
jgi:molybdopterin/thiamine biosynthesis adenylyltransferase